jgi:LysR family transcriptional regulator, glycine cleavage system transcriptional activator
MTKLPPLRALQAFEAFGRLGSVTDAARELGVSVGAVSQQLRKAEDAVAVRLLERRGRTVELTAQGRQYHAGLSAGFHLIRTAQDAVARSQSASTLTISCLPSLASKWLGSLLLDWQIKHPGATVLLNGEDTEPSFAGGDVDYRISYGDKIKGYDHAVELFTDWAVPACSPGFLAQHPLQDPANILELPLLGITWSRDQGAPPGWSDWAASLGVTYRRKAGEVTFSLSSAAIDAAMNGRGFVLAQLSMTSDDISAGRLVVPFDNRIKLSKSYFLAWDRAVLKKPFGPELRAWLTATAKRQKSVPD